MSEINFIEASSDSVLPDTSNVFNLSGVAEINISIGEKKINIELKPMLFYGDIFYPLAGWNDFQGYFDTIEQAKEELLKQYPQDKWGHIVKDGKIVLKGLISDDGEWEFEEVFNEL
jgi:hypothetical protein